MAVIDLTNNFELADYKYKRVNFGNSQFYYNQALKYASKLDNLDRYLADNSEYMTTEQNEHISTSIKIYDELMDYYWQRYEQILQDDKARKTKYSFQNKLILGLVVTLVSVFGACTISSRTICADSNTQFCKDVRALPEGVYNYFYK